MTDNEMIPILNELNKKIRSRSDQTLQQQLMDCAEKSKQELIIKCDYNICDFLRIHNIPWIYSGKIGCFDNCRIWIPDFDPPHYYHFKQTDTGNYSSSFVESLHLCYKNHSIQTLKNEIKSAVEVSIETKYDSYRRDFLESNNIPYSFQECLPTQQNAICIWLSTMPCPFYYRYNEPSLNVINNYNKK